MRQQKKDSEARQREGRYLNRFRSLKLLGSALWKLSSLPVDVDSVEEDEERLDQYPENRFKRRRDSEAEPISSLRSASPSACYAKI